jgi:hypothetical protein
MSECGVRTFVLTLFLCCIPIALATVLSGNSTVVDISSFAPGIYFVRINKGSVVYTGRFIRN